MNRRIFCIVLCLFVLVGAMQASGQGEVENLAINGDFEDGVLDPWRITFKPNANGDAELSIDDEESFTDDFCLKVEIRSGGNDERAVHIIQQPILTPIKKDEKYTYCAWMKAEEPRPAVLNTMKSGGGNVSSPNRGDFTLTEEWAEYWFTLTATADADFRLEFVLGLSDATVWVDHVRFYEGEYVDEGLGQPEAVTRGDNMLVTCWSRIKARGE